MLEGIHQIPVTLVHTGNAKTEYDPCPKETYILVSTDHSMIPETQHCDLFNPPT